MNQRGVNFIASRGTQGEERCACRGSTRCGATVNVKRGFISRGEIQHSEKGLPTRWAI